MRSVVVTVTLALLASSCASAPQPAPSTAAASGAEVVLSLQEITCRSCGAESIQALRQQAGVLDVAFDGDKAELTVRYDDARLTPDALCAAVATTGNKCVVGGGQGSYTAEVKYPDGADVRWISKDGAAVDVEAHLAPGKITVVDFFAEWCGPCKDVDRQLLSYVETRDDVAVRKVDVKSWESPVAKRYLAGVTQIPYVIVYDKVGKRVDAIAGLDLARLDAAVATASQQAAPSQQATP